MLTTFYNSYKHTHIIVSVWTILSKSGQTQKVPIEVGKWYWLILSKMPKPKSAYRNWQIVSSNFE